MRQDTTVRDRTATRRDGIRSGRRRAAAARTLLAVLVAGALAAVLAPGATASAGGSAPAYLRPAHLVPELGTMDIRLTPFSAEGGDGSNTAPLLQTSASYGGVGDYVPLDPGRYAVGLRPAGTDPSEPPLLQLTFSLAPGQAYTVAGLGSASDPRLELLEDRLDTPAAGSADVRVLAASARAPEVTVAVAGEQVGTASLGTASGYSGAPAGTSPVEVTGPAGTAADDEVDLQAGGVYTLLVLDDTDSDDGVEVRPVLDAAGPQTVPQGAAATGFGGLAAPEPGSRAVTTLAALVAGAAALVLVVLGVTRQRPAPARARRTRARRS
ncbi:DUF4397 domain-containing protein [Aquipuribacter sp. SD81]|uniref:DUF4397 domain-containing protein n=1 Tax=Aquipuribacter sp. SD81 TaxID=3127703 RepID=UPI00301AEFE4